MDVKNSRDDNIAYIRSLLKDIDKIVSKLELEKSHPDSLGKGALSSEIESIRQNQLASIGSLIDGVVHNVLGPLTVIMGRSQLLRAKMPEMKEFDLIISSVEKIKELLNNVVQKSKMVKETERVEYNINELLSTELKFLESDHNFKHNITKEFNFYPELPDIEILYSEFSQAIIDIIESSIDDMNEMDLKKLSVSTNLIDDTILIDISDTGNGISTEIVQNIYKLTEFEDRYPGGELPVGSKVNLVKALRVLKKYGAEVGIESTEGLGSAFRIKIPLS